MSAEKVGRNTIVKPTRLFQVRGEADIAVQTEADWYASLEPQSLTYTSDGLTRFQSYKRFYLNHNIRHGYITVVCLALAAATVLR